MRNLNMFASRLHRLANNLCVVCKKAETKSYLNVLFTVILKTLSFQFRHYVTIQNGWNNRISDGCVYAQIRRGLGMHLVTYSNHDTVLFLLIVPIKGRFV